MAVDRGFGDMTSALAVELPHTPPPDEPTWCENYCFDVHDTALGLSMWLHLSRSQLHPTLWREVINLFLPDGRIAVWKGYGAGPEVRDRPGGPTIAVDVVAPFERLDISGNGVVRLTDEDELARGPLADGLEVGLGLDLRWQATTDVWDLRTQMADQVWATGHYEQGARVTGSVSVAGERWELDGTGWRDHSIGPRNNAGMQDHDWAHAVFPGLGAVAIFRHCRVGVGQDLGGAFVQNDAGAREAELVSLSPAASWPPDPTGTVEIVLDAGDGPEAVTAELLRTAWSGSAPPAYQVLGRPLSGGHLRWESQALFTWRGQQSLGMFERTMKLE